MKQIRFSHIVSGILSLALLISFAASRLAAQSRVFQTKHNLSAVGPGTIKAASEGQTCVFCHTPHAPSASVQLWNHQLSTASYDLYSSDYLTHLDYATPDQPNQRSKFCLSCHDGTVAIGAVYNNRLATSITMANNVTTMPGSSLSNLGTSLRDDHPVGYIYDNSKDNELVNRNWPWNTTIKLDPDASNGTVECITCHDPHDNSNTKFLRMPNTNAALCTFCHNKANWSDAVHKTSTQAYLTQPDSIHTTVGEWACRSCHKAHNGEGVPYLLNKVEENTCFESGCHGTAVTGVNTKNIQSEYLKTFHHPTVAEHGKHLNPDNQASLSVPNRHAECQDCHNLHQAKKGLHSPKSNLISDVLFGTRGVTPADAASWTQPTSFTENLPSQQENQICFKCHSYYAFGLVPNGVTTIRLPQTNEYVTDQAMEFNRANKSAHPVQFSSNNQLGALAPNALDVSQMTAGWDSVGLQTMYCSDCHGNDQQTSANTPQGPHGSNMKFLLTGNGKYWPTTIQDSLWTLDDIRYNRNNWQNNLFCANCHSLFNGMSFENNAHDAPDHIGKNIACVTCHVAVPHGSKRSRLIGYETDVQPYNYNGSSLAVTGFQKAISRTGYTLQSCSTNNVACHGTQAGSYEQ